MGADMLDGLHAIFGDDDFEPGAFQDAPGEVADARLVVGHQHEAGADHPGLGQRGLGGFGRVDSPALRRQVHPEKGSRSRPALDIHAAAMAPDDTLHGRQTQTPPREFGGEEGIENPGLGLAIHPGPRIHHLQEYEGTRVQGLGHAQAGHLRLA